LIYPASKINKVSLISLKIKSSTSKWAPFYSKYLLSSGITFSNFGFKIARHSGSVTASNFFSTNAAVVPSLIAEAMD